MKFKIVLAILLISYSIPVFADDNLMEVDQVVEYVEPGAEGSSEGQNTDGQSANGQKEEVNDVPQGYGASISSISSQMGVNEEIGTVPQIGNKETEVKAEMEVATETEAETETESNLPNYYRVTLSKLGVSISVPVFNENDTWETSYSSDVENVSIGYDIKHPKDSIEDYLVFSAEKFENSLKDEGYEEIENSGVLDTDNGMRYLGIFCSKDGNTYKIYYGGMPLEDDRYAIIKIIGYGKESTILDLIASDFGFQKLVKYEENDASDLDYAINIGGDLFSLPEEFSTKGNWEVEKESTDGEYSSKTLIKDGYKVNIKTYNDYIYSVSIMTYNCDVEDPEVTVFDGKVGFGSSEQDLVSVLDELGLSYQKVETANDGSQYTVEDNLGSGYTFIIMNDKIYTISVINQGFTFEQEILTETESETENTIDTDMESITESFVGE